MVVSDDDEGMDMSETDSERHDTTRMSDSARRIRRAFSLGTGRPLRRWSNLVDGASTVFGVVPSAPHRRIDASRFMCRTDAEAIGQDWRAVGDDLRAAARRTR